MAQMEEDTVYVAVGKDIEASKPTLSWAFFNFPRRKLGILHVHQPAKMLPSSFGGGIPEVKKLGEHELNAYQELGRQIMNKILDDYLGICHRAGVVAEKLHIEKDDIRSGIVELIRRHNIKQLVMGAAADNYYSEGMTELKSMKAMYVCLHSPMSCQIWFTCKGNLIRTKFANQMTVPDDIVGRDIILAGGLSMSTETETGQFCRMKSPQRRADGYDHALELFALPWLGEPNLPVPNVMARAFESLYMEEWRHRVKIEEELARERESIKTLKKEWEKQHLFVLGENLFLDSQVKSLNDKTKVLESAQEMSRIYEAMSRTYQKERDGLQIERDNALKEAEELRKVRAEASSSAHQSRFFAEFSLTEIEEATQNFDPSLKIGEGGYGSIYKGLLRHTPVAIKMLHPHSMQGPSEFQQEVDVLSKMRHPNIVTLVGACPEAWALIYEYMPNGSLEDRLSCGDNSPPLSWQTRIRIATELCSVVNFLHSYEQHSIVHGDLKPANILLDANLVSKLSDFGICRLLYPTASSSNNTTICCRTDPKGTFAYMDPEFLASGELTPKSDVYSFGIILLKLLTARSAFGITKEVRYALDTGNLQNVLDPLAGDWPFGLAEKLVNLALRCCEIDRKNRPDLASEVWRVLEPMKASCGGSSCYRLGSKEHCQPPPYFICPVLQEVMHDPHVAADGFTYEAEALRVWLDSGRDTSPMTNLKLAHCDLVPNRALRSAIQEWLQQQ